VVTEDALKIMVKSIIALRWRSYITSDKKIVSSQYGRHLTSKR